MMYRHIWVSLFNKGIHVEVDSNDIVVIGQNFKISTKALDGTYLAVST